MATIIYQKDKRIGITYAYESVSYWDKEKKQSRSKRKLIGRVKEDGTIVPTDGRGHKRKKLSTNNPKKNKIVTRSFYGATSLVPKLRLGMHTRATIKTKQAIIHLVTTVSVVMHIKKKIAHVK